MAKRKKKSTSVYSRKLATGDGCILWLAHDHVMHASGGWGSTEMYRRFYFRDIQCILDRKVHNRRNRMIIGGLLLQLLIGFVALMVLAGSDGVSAGITFLLAEIVVFIPAMLYLFWAGRTVLVHFRTATQQVQISAIRNDATYQRVLQAILPLIREAQADFDGHDLAPRAAHKNKALTERSSRRLAANRAGARPPQSAPQSAAARPPSAPGAPAAPRPGPRPDSSAARPGSPAGTPAVTTPALADDDEPAIAAPDIPLAEPPEPPAEPAPEAPPPPAPPSPAPEQSDPAPRGEESGPRL